MAQKYKKSSKAVQLDQFYTKSSISGVCINTVMDLIPESSRKIFVEPSAGNGAFSNPLIDLGFIVYGFDADPKKDYIKNQDFFDVNKDYFGNYRSDEICIIGNPPFGKNSSMAVKFFNHAAKISDTICFILPRTFEKQSIKNRLNLFFHLIYSEILPKNSFIFEDKEYSVPCVFQIWERRGTKRNIIKSKTECDFFKFVKKDEADFAVRRAGGRAGTAFLDIKNLSVQSNHFCKITGSKNVEEVVGLINSIDFGKFINSTAGVRSLSKGELIREVERTCNGKNKIN